ncbi:hypothetical protein BEP19_07465 [Ammoniphilus oxalaticus]|uniref:Pilus assembly protein PilZ n=1 Tax=Ammoniphilus oxalaticus TaxID=66863 RepID=A0A419SJT3_9BACL|nr:flagellar brake domain-containing protein [Ammoniphilus oxalaticus]RKD24235.1 hypothetical protein BEP19_07465 [Ammoniphilus oxalaticus]
MPKRRNKSPKEMLVVGLPLQITTYAQDSMEEKDVTLKSRVAEDFGQEFAIEIPIEEGSGRMRHLLQGDEIYVVFIGEDGVMYSFPSKVKGKASDNIPLLRIEKPTDRIISRIQRRNYLRVPFELDISIIIQNPVKMLDLKTIDLSGGGLAFRVTETISLATGQMVAGVLNAPNGKDALRDIHFSGVVLRKLEANSERPYPLYAIQFIEIDERDRDHIIRICLQRQMELHKRLK